MFSYSSIKYSHVAVKWNTSLRQGAMSNQSVIDPIIQGSPCWYYQTHNQLGTTHVCDSFIVTLYFVSNSLYFVSRHYVKNIEPIEKLKYVPETKSHVENRNELKFFPYDLPDKRNDSCMQLKNVPKYH